VNYIIVPTYNEQQNIGPVIVRIFRALPDVSVLVVDDSSPDGTGDEVIKLKKRYPRLSLLKRKNKEGLGRAYIHAFQELALNAPDARYIAIMDADLSHAPEYLPAMFELARKYDVVVGSRYAKGGGVEGWEKWRHLLSVGGNTYARVITGLPMRDCTSGYCVFNAAALKKIPLERIDSSGYAFQVELKYFLFKSGSSFVELPITFTNRVGGESKLSSHIISEAVVAPWKMRIKK